MSLMSRCLPAFLLLTWPTLLAADLSHPRIPGWERFHAEAEPTATGGALLLGELNCLSCHQGTSELEKQLLHRQAPVLSAVGNRVTVEFLRGFLANPQQRKPGTLMPDLMNGLSDEERNKRVEALTHFLASTGTLAQTPPNGGSVRSGEKLFHTVGCVACHDPRENNNAASLTTSVPLGKLETKYGIPSLTAFLRNPHAVRPSGRMPGLNLKPEEARDIAHYLLRDIDVEPNINYWVYEGNWDKLPDFSALKEKSAGGATGFDLTVAGRTNNFGVRFEGYLHVREAGDYVFHVGSDDGAKLFVDGRPLVDVDGIHPTVRKAERMRLEPGPHQIRVDYFQGGGEWILEVEAEGPGIPKQDLGGLLTASKEPRQESAAFTPSAALVNQGREQFAAMGCANCHELKQNNQPIVSTLKSPSLSSLKPAGGCLEPTKGTPGFSLSAKQQKALAAFLAEGAKPLAETPEATIARTLTALNCYACHQRGDRGGVEAARNEFFVGAIPEMGDEGRLPPLLTSVGDKLNAEWLKHVLRDGASDRPYMLTRMPKFGHENVGGLITLLEQDQKEPLPPVAYKDSVLQVKSVGRHMVGDQALSCIKCHSFGKFKATGIQSLDLTAMTRRLRQDWFRRYMVNPQVYRPGTRMPTAWPNGETILPELLEADTQKQVNALWLYLSDGNRAGVPKGIVNATQELVPVDEPIIYRNFIQGLSPRGIAVGYPERYNLAFDAERMNLALIWQGSFIDAAMHWNGRGQGFQSPAGDAVLALPKDVPFAVINGEAPWPTQAATEYGYRFDGYRLDEQRRPHFRYSYKGMSIDDFPAPRVVGNTHLLARTIAITAEQGIPEHLWHRVAVGKAINVQSQGSVFVVDNTLTIALKAPAAEAVLKKQNGTIELWLPIPAGEKSFTVDLEMKW